VALPQTNNQPTQRVLIEPRGSRRLSSQTLLDLRVSRTLPFAGKGRVEFTLDLLNVLNNQAEESLATDNLFSRDDFGRPTVYIDPRRAMIGAKVNLGK
jgi:hypothetical protein